MRTFFEKYIHFLILSALLLLVFFNNFRPGYIIMGNDNFSPEINPALTIERSLLNPAWRSNRVLGIPSDSEQADLWRTIIFWISENILPTWAISQLYLFITFFVGVLSAGMLVKKFIPEQPRVSFLFGSLLYMFSLIPIWIYFYPVHLFVAAYAFTPLIIWRIFEVIDSPTRINKLILLFSSLLTGTTALTATMWLTTSATIVSISLFYLIANKSSIKKLLIALSIYVLPNLFWILPFSLYVQTNSDDLQSSYINREITTTTVQSEMSKNSAANTLRFNNSWLDTREDDQNYTYTYRNWFKENNLAIYLSFLPIVFALIGTITAIFQIKNKYTYLLTALIGLIGWLLLNGNNPPFVAAYRLLDNSIPLFHQVFRWGSSKFWPILFIPLIILAVLGITSIINLLKAIKIHKLFIFITFTCIVTYGFPVLTSNFIRNQVFVKIPNEYKLIAKQVDNNARIDTVPHTNTRYFRRYEWGFWGSVFLNYLYPQPTTEKALIIGSSENETAYNVIDEAYHTGNPDIYARVLKRFNINTILSDKSVTNNELGSSYSYPYAWELHDTMVKNNSNFKQVQSLDNLNLYTNLLPSNKSRYVSTNHNSEFLNKILASTTNVNFILQDNSADIFPIAIQPSSIISDHKKLSLSSTIKLNNNNPYKLLIRERDLQQLPLIANYEKNILNISPYYPSLQINQEAIYTLPQSTVKLNTNADLISLNNQVINAPQEVPIENNYSIKSWTTKVSSNITEVFGPNKIVPCNANESISSTSNFNKLENSLTITTKNRTCLQSNNLPQSTGPHKISFTANSRVPAELEVCIHSLNLNKCLNHKKTYFVNSSLSPINIVTDLITPPNDELIIFMVIKSYLNQNNEFTLTNLVHTTYKLSDSKTVVSPAFNDINKNIELSNNDQITLSFPLLPIIPSLQSFFALCPERGYENDFSKHINSITLISSNCFDGLYSSFSLPNNDNYQALLTYLKSDYIRGIPLELNLKQDKVERKIMTDLAKTETQSEMYHLTLLPQTNQIFTVELVNKGLGISPSENRIIEFNAIPIPSSWLNLQLVADSNVQPMIYDISPKFSKDTGTYSSQFKGDGIYTISQATSPYWKIITLPFKPNIVQQYLFAITKPSIGTKMTINGWQQAWEISKPSDEYLSVVFMPNILAYAGLIVGVLSALIISIWRHVPARATKNVVIHKVSQST